MPTIISMTAGEDRHLPSPLQFNQLPIVYYFLRFPFPHFPALRTAFIITFVNGNDREGSKRERQQG